MTTRSSAPLWLLATGGPLVVSLTVAVGGRGAASDPPPEVTYAEHVAPVLAAECVDCHRPGGSAPFSLVTYDEVRRRAVAIARATAEGRMPPWLPESSERFVGERRLTDDEIALFRMWAETGAPPGDLSEAPDPPAASTGWELGEPDLVVEFPSYTLEPHGRDVFRNLVAPAPVDQRRHVSAAELEPGDPGVVHHAVMMVDTTGSSRSLDARHEGAGFDNMEPGSNVMNPGGHLLGWTPGKGALPPLEDMAWSLDPGTDLVLKLHLRPTGSEELIRSRVGLHFTDGPPAERPALLVLESAMIDIPPGEAGYRVTTSYELPVGVDVLSVYPHAHYLGDDLRGYATLPGGAVRELIHIPDWDFNWQDQYRYVEPVRLPAGTKLTLDYTYDNSAGNPQNPSDPPRRVTYGLSSADEMAQLILQVLPHDPARRQTLLADAARHNEMQSAIYRAVQEARRGDRSLRAGDPDRAIAHYQEAMRHRSDRPRTLLGLTRAFLMKEDYASARLAGERAAQVTRRRDPEVLSVLAEAYAGLGNGDGAVTTAEEALRRARDLGRSALADSLEARLPGYRELGR